MKRKCRGGGFAWESLSQARRAVMWQFSLRSMIAAVAYVALVLAWARWFAAEYYFDFYAWWGICSVGVVLMACVELGDPSRCGSAWNLIVLAWLMVIAEGVYAVVMILDVVSCTHPEMLAGIIQECVCRMIISEVTVPLFCTIPPLCVLAGRCRSRRGAISRWVSVSLAVALVDAVLVVGLVLRTLGTWGR